MPYKQYECSDSYTRTQHTLIHYIFVSGVFLLLLSFYSIIPSALLPQSCVYIEAHSTAMIFNVDCSVFGAVLMKTDLRISSFCLMFSSFLRFFFLGSVSRANPVFLVAVEIN